MSYQGPIEVITSQMRSQVEGEIYRAVIDVGVNVDKNELLKALQYDRGQYQKGYEDRDNQIVRCKNCKWYSEDMSWCNNSMSPKEQTFFCADGKRREENA